MQPDLTSFVLVARDASGEEILGVVNRLEEIIRLEDYSFEIIIVRQGRSMQSWRDTEQILLGRSNVLVIDSIGSSGDLEGAVQGLNQSIGDFVVLLELDSGQVELVPEVLARLGGGRKLVLGVPSQKVRSRLIYSAGRRVFAPLYRSIHGLESATEVPLFRGMSRDSLSILLSSPQPEILLRYPGAISSLDVERLSYAPGKQTAVKGSDFWSAYGSAMKLLLGGSRAPLRFASLLALLGAIANVIYAIYVLVISLIRDDLAQGWASTALQVSGMFFLVSLVLLLISEYLLQVVPTSRYSRITSSESFDYGSRNGQRANVQTQDQTE